MTIHELATLAKRLLEEGTPREDIYAFLDGKAAHNPDLTPAVAAVKAMLQQFLAQGNINDAFTKSLAEVLSLLRTKYGPVSDAPEIGLI